MVETKSLPSPKTMDGKGTASDTVVQVEQPPPWSTVKEERRNTGRYVVVIVVAFACLLGLYQACLQQNAVLAGLIVPALIMVIYVAWVLYTARHSQKQTLSTSGQDSNLNLTVIGSLVYCERSALDHVATETGKNG
uniref:Uncharacterized protein n=1 Tax=Timema douglasi TaxID=61478 RepID=A0A7R8ZD32_TIMDO|nr:unnamed protein product [Timema douglasi]